MELLTPEEHDFVRDAGLLYTRAEQIVSYGPNRDGDLAEIRAAIHVIQRAVLAQGTARYYSGRYRLLGLML